MDPEEIKNRLGGSGANGTYFSRQSQPREKAVVWRWKEMTT